MTDPVDGEQYGFPRIDEKHGFPRILRQSSRELSNMAEGVVDQGLDRRCHRTSSFVLISVGTFLVAFLVYFANFWPPWTVVNISGSTFIGAD